jgi:hypothetical protein
MDSFTLDGEPDSAELLMMEIDIPEPEKQEDRDSDRNMDFDANSDFEDFLLDDRFSSKEAIRTHSFMKCGLSKEFSVDGFIISQEFERFLKNEQPVNFNLVSKNKTKQKFLISNSTLKGVTSYQVFFYDSSID